MNFTLAHAKKNTKIWARPSRHMRDSRWNPRADMRRHRSSSAQGTLKCLILTVLWMRGVDLKDRRLSDWSVHTQCVLCHFVCSRACVIVYVHAFGCTTHVCSSVGAYVRICNQARTSHQQVLDFSESSAALFRCRPLLENQASTELFSLHVNTVM